MQSGSKTFLVTHDSLNINFYVENKIEYTSEVFYSVAYSLLQNQTVKDLPPYFADYLSLEPNGPTLSPSNSEEYWITLRRYTYAIQLFELVASDKNNAAALASSCKYILDSLNAFYAELAKNVSLTPDLNKAIEKVVLAKLKCKCLKTSKRVKQIMAENHYNNAMNNLKLEIILAKKSLEKPAKAQEENKKESPRKALGKLNSNKCNFWFVPHVHEILKKDQKNEKLAISKV